LRIGSKDFVFLEQLAKEQEESIADTAPLIRQ
jgi:hypothetical protein